MYTLNRISLFLSFFFLATNITLVFLWFRARIVVKQKVVDSKPVIQSPVHCGMAFLIFQYFIQNIVSTTRISIRKSLTKFGIISLFLFARSTSFVAFLDFTRFITFRRITFHFGFFNRNQFILFFNSVCNYSNFPYFIFCFDS